MRNKYVFMDEANAGEGGAGGGGGADDGGVLDGGDNGSGGVEFGADGYKYAGKYATPQELETGYKESVSMHTQKMSEMGDKLKAFVGAPEGDYESVDGTDGYSDPVMKSIQEWGKDNGLSQDAYGSLLKTVRDADAANLETFKADQMKLLGKDADQRITNINDKWAARFGADSLDLMNGMGQTAAQIEFFESILESTSEGRVNPDGSDAGGQMKITQTQIDEMMHKEDSAGMMKMQTDPSYAKEVYSAIEKFNKQQGIG